MKKNFQANHCQECPWHLDLGSDILFQLFCSKLPEINYIKMKEGFLGLLGRDEIILNSRELLYWRKYRQKQHDLSM
jgi:hypothetical protein